MPHPDYLDGMLTAKQMNEWIAYQALEPFGARREDLRAGMITSTFINANRGKDSPIIRPDEIFPEFITESEAEVVEREKLAMQQKEYFLKAFAAAGIREK